MSLLSAVKHDCGHAINRLLPKNTIIYILEMPTACHFSLLNLLREQMLTNLSLFPKSPRTPKCVQIPNYCSCHQGEHVPIYSCYRLKVHTC